MLHPLGCTSCINQEKKKGQLMMHFPFIYPLLDLDGIFLQMQLLEQALSLCLTVRG